jgi:tetratricopeptide (TPR) repeat protein
LRARFESSSGPAAAILAGAALIAYANSFFGAFQFDDFPTILEDSRLDSLAAFCSQLTHMIRPFLKFTFFLDRRLYGENPLGYHLLNFLLHLGSALLVYVILRQASASSAAAAASGGGALAPVPFWTALLFLVHPIATETVTYISGRATGLMAFCFLAALCLFITSTESERNPTIFSLRYWGALLCFGLSLLSKEAAVTLPVALLLWDVVLRRRRGTALRQAFLRWHLLFWVLLLLFLLLAYLHPRYAYLARYSLALRPWYENLLSQVNTVCFALSLFFVPSLLNFDHDLPLYRSLWQWPTPLSLLLLAALLAAAFFSRRKAPLLSFGLFWFFLQLAPTNSLVPRYDLLSERNLYLASIGFFLSLAECARLLVNKLIGGGVGAPHSPPTGPTRARVLWALGSLLVLSLIFSTISRNRIYRDQLTLWTDAARKSPRKPRAHNNRGYAYYLRGDFPHAIEEFRFALSLDRDYQDAQQNLRNAWLEQKSQTMHSKPNSGQH